MKGQDGKLRKRTVPSCIRTRHVQPIPQSSRCCRRRRHTPLPILQTVNAPFFNNHICIGGGGGWGGAGDSAVALAHLCHCIRVAKQRQQKRRVWGNKRRPRLTHVRWVQKKRNQSKVCICLIGNKEEEQPQHSKWMRSNQLCENTDIPFLLPILLQCHHTDKKVPSGTKQW